MDFRYKLQTIDEHGSWRNCEHKDWAELISDGWIFVGLDRQGNVNMTRNGYLNKFR